MDMYWGQTWSQLLYLVRYLSYILETRYLTGSWNSPIQLFWLASEPEICLYPSPGLVKACYIWLFYIGSGKGTQVERLSHSLSPRWAFLKKYIYRSVWDITVRSHWSSMSHDPLRTIKVPNYSQTSSLSFISYEDSYNKALLLCKGFAVWSVWQALLSWPVEVSLASCSPAGYMFFLLSLPWFYIYFKYRADLM